MYLALYRKWRPKLFDDVVAQKHVALTLKNEVRLGKIAHAYLFTGPKGTGKTSCARIFSKAVNCLHSNNGEPCLDCEVCKGIENGTILDVVEMDGASSNSVNDVKILKDEAGFVPSYCKFKIYVIDEVHMLSTSAFNALLKIMEEPPDYVIFILATTEVKKVLPTIVSRCQRFDFRRVGVDDVVERLFKICELENINLTKEAALKIASMADGSLRDAVSVLDECSIACGDSEIDLKLVNQIFGLVDEKVIFDFFNAVVCGDCSKALSLVEEVYCRGVSLQSFCSDLTYFFREIIVFLIYGSNKSFCSNVFLEVGFEKILSFLKCLNLDFVVKVLGDCVDCFESFKLSLNARMKFELFVLNLCLKFRNSGLKSVGFVDKHESNELVEKGKIENSKKAFSDVVGDDVDVEIIDSNVEDSNKMERFGAWPDILEEIKSSLGNRMISGFLVDSEAFVTSDDRLYINFKNPVVSRKVFERKNDIALIIKQKTGHNYRIFIKKSENETVDFTNEKLENFIDVARSCDVEIEES